MTSIEWLAKQLLNAEPNVLEWQKYILQAKEMHKKEIMDAVNDISEKNVKYANNIISSFTKIDGELFMHDKNLAEQYYQEKFNKY